MKQIPALILLLAASLLLGPGGDPVRAGEQNPPAGPGEVASAMPTLSDLDNRLATGAAGITRSGGFSEPEVGPGPASPTLDAVLAKAPARDEAGGATPEQVLEGKPFWGLTSGAWGLRTGSAPAGSAVSGPDGQRSFVIPAGLYSGGQGCTANDTDLLAANIKSGVTLFGVTGSDTGPGCPGTAQAGDVLAGRTFSGAAGIGLTGTMPEVTAAQPSTGQAAIAGAIALTPPAGYYDGSDQVTATEAQLAALDPDIAPAKIRHGVAILGITGTLTEATAPPSPRFTDNNNGTVTDQLTGLIWLRDASCSALAGTDSNGKATQTVAGTAAASLSSGTCSLTDGSIAGAWRLPTFSELWSLVDHGHAAPALPAGHPFLGVVADNYWSSTPDISGSVWAVHFAVGSTHLANIVRPYYLWPVRN